MPDNSPPQFIAIINALIAAIISYTQFGVHIIPGLKLESMIVAVVGAMTGTIWALKKNIKKNFTLVLIFLAMVLTGFVIWYDKIIAQTGGTPLAILLAFFLLLFVFIIGSLILTYFERLITTKKIA